LAKWGCISQKSIWKVGHAIREMMDPGNKIVPALRGIVELDENTLAANPDMKEG